MNIAKLKTKAEGLVTQLTTKDECEKRVYDAVSNKSWAAHPTLLNEIAEDTFQYDRYSVVMRLVWKTVEGPARNWRSIAKSLILIEHLLKHGAEKVVSDVQQHIHDIRALTEFSYMDGNLDRGKGVRERARELVDLLRNPDRIRSERLRARDLKAQYSGYGGDSASSPPPKPFSGGGSSRDFRDSSSPRHWDDRDGGRESRASGGRGDSGGTGRDVADEWSAAYDRSPSPSPVSKRSVHSRTLSVGSDTIDFDAGREEYSSRLTRYQEQEKREAAATASGSRPRRRSKDSTGSSHRSSSPDRGSGKRDSKRREDRKSTEEGGASVKQTEPDLLSGDPCPAAAPNRRSGNDFSSFVLDPNAYQNGPQQGGGDGWNGGGVGQLQGDGGGGYEPIVPYGQTQEQQQQQPQQPQQVNNQQWGGQQPHQGMQGMQHGMGGMQGMYGQQQYGSQQGHGYGRYGNVNQPQQPQFGQIRQPQPSFGQQQHPQQQDYNSYQQQQYQQQPNQQYYGQHHPQQQLYQGQHQQDQFQGQQHQQPPQQQQPYQGQPQQYHNESQGPYSQQEQQQQSFSQEQQQQQPRSFQQQQPQQQTQPHQHQLPPPPASDTYHQPPQQPSQSQPQQQQYNEGPRPSPPQNDPSVSRHLQPQSQQRQQQQPAGQGSGSEKEWVPTEVVRAGIAMPDLAAAVGGLRQTGFKLSDVGGGVYSGQGRRVGAPGAPAPRAPHHPPPQQPHQTVEYIEEGQEIVNADTREFQSALGGLRKTGLSSRLRDVPQQQQQSPASPPVPPVPPTPSAALSPAAPATVLRAGPTPSVAGAGQWQGLPQQQQSTGAAPSQQRPSWQGAAGKLKSTGLMGTGNGSALASGLNGGGQGQGMQGEGLAPWQQGVAGLRKTGLGSGGGQGVEGGDGSAGGLDMGRLNLNDGDASGQQHQQQQWRT